MTRTTDPAVKGLERATRELGTAATLALVTLPLALLQLSALIPFQRTRFGRSYGLDYGSAFRILIALSILFYGFWLLSFRVLPGVCQALCSLEAKLRGRGAELPTTLTKQTGRLCLSGLLLWVVFLCLLPDIFSLTQMASRSSALPLQVCLAGFGACALAAQGAGFLAKAATSLLQIGRSLRRDAQPWPTAALGGPSAQHHPAGFLPPPVRRSARRFCLLALTLGAFSLTGLAWLSSFPPGWAGNQTLELCVKLGSPALACALVGQLVVLGMFVGLAGRTLEALQGASASLRAARHGAFDYAPPVATDRLLAAASAMRVFGYLTGLLGSLASYGLLSVAVEAFPRAAGALMVAWVLGLAFFGALPVRLGSFAAAAGKCLAACCRGVETSIVACERPGVTPEPPQTSPAD